MYKPKNADPDRGIEIFAPIIFLELLRGEFDGPADADQNAVNLKACSENA